MRRIQAAALDLFEADGYDATSVEAIATYAQVGPATVYRAFGSKEAIALWDDSDPRLLEAFAAQLHAHGPADALLAAATESLAEAYDTDRARRLRRATIIRAIPAIERAAFASVAQLRAALAATLLAHRPKRVRDTLEAAVFAGALASTLQVALDHWREDDGKTSLTRCLKLAFARLPKLVEPSP